MSGGFSKVLNYQKIQRSP